MLTLDNRIAIRNLFAGYGAVRVLEDVSLDVASGQTAVLLGVNGNGKSTLIKCIMGMCKPSAGAIEAHVDGQSHDLLKLTTEEIVDLGIGLVPEGRRLFPKLTVEENLLLGAYRPAARVKRLANLEFVFETFPRLAERRRQPVALMSGGEQQMVALGRALMLEPKILIVDEPSVGLAPIFVARTIDVIDQLKRVKNLTVLMAEQNFNQAIRVADTGYVIVHGQIAFTGRSRDELNNSELIRRLYLGA
ncbi:MAG TPA: ABC transporter ATP-binding protein [Beijerinckiaceae bacterium]|nr:ABC transporter ATP-binding protein [Beijerinckiaceae bacterium]